MPESKQNMARTKQTPKKPHPCKKYQFPMQDFKAIAKEMKWVDNCISKAAMAQWVYLDKLCTVVFFIPSSISCEYVCHGYILLHKNLFIILFIINLQICPEIFLPELQYHKFVSTYST